jgi:hypothetical protein
MALAKAGRHESAFDAPAVERLYELAGGVPRRVRQLAELALLAGAGQQLGCVGPDTVESVYHELSVSATGALP